MDWFHSHSEPVSPKIINISFGVGGGVFCFSLNDGTKASKVQHFLHLTDGALRWHEVDRVRWRHVERLGFPVEAGALAGHAQVALTGGDDLSDELFAVYTDFHGDPVLSERLG